MCGICRAWGFTVESGRTTEKLEIGAAPQWLGKYVVSARHDHWSRV
jgi:hypothetical protein